MSNPIDRHTSALADRYTIEHELGAGGLESQIAQKQADENADVVW